LIGRLRAIRPELKAIVITGHGAILDRERLQWWEEARRLTKPFGLDELTAAVADLIGEPEGMTAPYQVRFEPPSDR
jgi:DNA-binding NtrC family response regulator